MAYTHEHNFLIFLTLLVHMDELQLSNCLKNDSKCRLRILVILAFFTNSCLLKIDLVTLFDQKLQVFEKSPNELFLAFIHKLVSTQSVLFLILILWRFSPIFILAGNTV